MSYPRAGGIRALRRGQLLPPTHLLELKTCFEASLAKRKSPIDWKSAVPRWLLSETSQLYVGIHDEHGSITRIEQFTRQALAKRQDKEKAAFQRLRAALAEIRQVLLDQQLPSGSQLALVCLQGRMGLYVRDDGNDTLPDDVLRRFQV